MTDYINPDCEICVYAQDEGSWPPDHRGTHCGLAPDACHRSWTGKGQSHCPVCHRHFGSNPAGDAHRPGPAGSTECVDPEGFDKWETPDGPIFGGKDPQIYAEMRKKAEEARQEGTSGGSDSAEIDETEEAA